MDKVELAHLLRMMGDLLQIKGEDPFKVRSYGKAADSIEYGDFDLDLLAREGRLLEIPMIGKNLEPKVRDIILTGRSPFIEELVREIPGGVLDLLRVPGIGPKTAGLLYHNLGIAGLDDLGVALAANKIRTLPGMGKKREELMAEGLTEILRFAGKISLGVALPVVESIAHALGQKGIRAQYVGEVRRYEEAVASMDVLIALDGQTPEELVVRSGIVPVDDRNLLRQAWNDTLGCYSFSTGIGIPLRMFFEESDVVPVRAAFLTGPSSFLEFLSERAGSRGLKISEREVMRGGKAIPVRSEAALFHELGLAYVPAELRHRRQFLEAAARGEEPDVVRLSDLRGDLHLHTSWSDGTASIERMVQAAIEAGYSYIAVTDHATPMAMIRGITSENLDAHLEEVRDVQAKYPDFRVYSGVEVDILKGGKLYLPDEDLARLDVVVASVHQDLDSKDEGLSRLAVAAANPNVDILGHPTGRKIGRRPGLGMDLGPVPEIAAKSNTVFEINSSPERLDLSEPLVAEAYSAGARFAVSADCHSLSGLGGIRYGVLACAARAGIPARAVVNTGSVPAWPSDE